MTEQSQPWQTTYSPGGWVAIAGDRAILLLPPAPPAAAGLMRGVWQAVDAAADVDEVAAAVAQFRLATLPSLCCFFLADDGLRVLLRGDVAVADADSGDTVATADGAVTWSEVSLADHPRVLVTLPGARDDALQLPLRHGAAQVGRFMLDATASTPVRLVPEESAEAGATEEPDTGVAQVDAAHATEAADHEAPAVAAEAGSAVRPVDEAAEPTVQIELPRPEVEADPAARGEAVVGHATGAAGVLAGAAGVLAGAEEAADVDDDDEAVGSDTDETADSVHRTTVAHEAAVEDGAGRPAELGEEADQADAPRPVALPEAAAAPVLAPTAEVAEDTDDEDPAEDEGPDGAVETQAAPEEAAVGSGAALVAEMAPEADQADDDMERVPFDAQALSEDHDGTQEPAAAEDAVSAPLAVAPEVLGVDDLPPAADESAKDTGSGTIVAPPAWQQAETSSGTIMALPAWAGAGAPPAEPAEEETSGTLVAPPAWASAGAPPAAPADEESPSGTIVAPPAWAQPGGHMPQGQAPRGPQGPGATQAPAPASQPWTPMPQQGQPPFGGLAPQGQPPFGPLDTPVPPPAPQHQRPAGVPVERAQAQPLGPVNSQPTAQHPIASAPEAPTGAPVIASMPTWGGSAEPEHELLDDGGTLYATGIASTHKPGRRAVDDGRVLASMCPRGHANPVGVPTCFRCGAPVEVGSPRMVQQPAVASVVAPDGQRLDIAGAVLVGRSPSPQQGDSNPQLLSVMSPHHDVSRTHLRLTVKDWQVQATDLHSTNGTELVGGDGRRTPLVPGIPTMVLPGVAIDLGDGVVLTLQAPLA